MTVMKITCPDDYRSTDLSREKKILSEKKVAGRPAFGTFPETSKAEVGSSKKRGGNWLQVDRRKDLKTLVYHGSIFLGVKY